jgi:flagella basal body P-ring formation protein FlgA
MKTTTKNTGIKINTGVKAGGFGQWAPNHNRGALKIKTAIKAGTVIQAANHNQRLFTLKAPTTNSGIKVHTGVKAGGLGGFCGPNHNRSALKIKTTIKAGTVIQAANHNQRLFALKAPTNAGIKVNTGVKAGGLGGFCGPNHSRSALKLKTAIKAGTVIQAANHNTRLLALA